jgi:hypothetical protein
MNPVSQTGFDKIGEAHQGTDRQKGLHRRRAISRRGLEWTGERKNKVPELKGHKKDPQEKKALHQVADG